jgi:hypothetical protein
MPILLTFKFLEGRMAEILRIVAIYRYGGESTYSLSSSVLNYQFEVRLDWFVVTRFFLISIRRMADDIMPTTKENTLWYG